MRNKFARAWSSTIRPSRRKSSSPRQRSPTNGTTTTRLPPSRPRYATFFQEEHACTPEEFRTKQGPKKFGQELVRSTIPEGRLKGRFKERFAYIYDQITKLGKYNGIVFVVDEYRFWQDRHSSGHGRLCRGRGGPGNPGLRSADGTPQHHHDRGQPRRHSAEALRRAGKATVSYPSICSPTRTKATSAKS